MPEQISKATKDVLSKLKSVMGEAGKTKKITIKSNLNQDDGKKLKLNAEAPENINDKLIEDSYSSAAKIDESLESQTPLQPEEPAHENDSPKSSLETEFTLEDDTIESLDAKASELSELNDHYDDDRSEVFERNWQAAVQEELKDVIQFNDSINNFDSFDLDQDFGIDKINNVKSVMNLPHTKNLAPEDSVAEPKENENTDDDSIIEFADDTQNQTTLDDAEVPTEANSEIITSETTDLHATEASDITTTAEADNTDNEQQLEDSETLVEDVQKEVSQDIYEAESKINTNSDSDSQINFSEAEIYDINNNHDTIIVKPSPLHIDKEDLQHLDNPDSDQDINSIISKIEPDPENDLNEFNKLLDEVKDSYFDTKTKKDIQQNSFTDVSKKINFKQKVKKMQNSSNKVMSDSTYNRAKNIIDSFRNQINNNVEEEVLELANSNNVNNNGIEDFVASLLKPMLKEWLDENLSQMVEEIVTKEVKKLTEDQ